jgi:hypothetical protein
VVLRSHLVELGFPVFVEAAPADYLFLKVAAALSRRWQLAGALNAA